MSLTRKFVLYFLMAFLGASCSKTVQAPTQGVAEKQEQPQAVALPRYWETVQRFKQADAEKAPPKNAILFLGSSSFTNWRNAQQMFPENTILNRGFGGSQLPDINLYLSEVGYPEDVKQIVIYSGDNDLASGREPEEVLQRYQAVLQQIRKDKPTLPVAFISIKECPGRASIIPKVQKTNTMLKAYLIKQQNTAFVDIVKPTVTADGKPMPEIYVEDGVHMNQKGYEIWAAELRPYLKK